MSRERILLVDDSAETIEVLQRNLASKYEIATARDVAEAVRLLEVQPQDLVITDFKMPRATGLDLVRHVRENFKHTEIMMITGYASIGGAVEAIKTGADEYLAKPFTDEELFAAVRRALSKLNARRAATARPPAPALPGLIGESASMREVSRAVAKAASSVATVLITGESGTGKELIARAIHYGSRRAAAPFLPVSCGGIPESLVESELFGYVKGAFTGAVESRAGFFQAADGGTVFLDEAGELSPPTQVKLLRVLQEREICMVGSTRPCRVDVRVVAATNKNLLSLVRQGTFREDLYFRLNVLVIDVPPLRDRGDDVLILAGHFAARFAAEAGKPAPRLTEGALQVLRNHNWPGNVRELENLVRRLCVMMDGDVIDVPDLPAIMRFSAPRSGGPPRTLAQVEAEHIRRVMSIVDGNKTRAAEILGIDRKTLREKLSRTGVAEPAPE